MDVAERSGDRDALATVYAELLGLEHVAGNLETALGHGWAAVATFESDEVGRTRCLAVLAGTLADYGDREAAEDAWAIVAHTSDERFYQIYAYDALAHLSALRGDGIAFEDHARRCDELDWENGPLSAKAEILFYRGLSFQALGQFEVAERWLERAMSFSQEHGFSRMVFRAVDALGKLVAPSPEEARRAPAAPPEVREGVRAMRRELVGA
jgi:tetratricopeptide (TPR) repeat protein